MTDRHENWQRRLNELVTAETRARPDGHPDDLMFVRKAVRAVTGHWPPKERGANRYATLRRWFGNPVPGAWGRRGDIAWLDGRAGVIIGVRAVFIYEDGVSVILISKIDKAFRVG